MGKKENQVYLQAIARRYRRASRTAKGVILVDHGYYFTACFPIIVIARNISWAHFSRQT